MFYFKSMGGKVLSELHVAELLSFSTAALLY